MKEGCYARRTTRPADPGGRLLNPTSEARIRRHVSRLSGAVRLARYRYLTTREANKLTPTQAQSVIAAAILRHLHAVITTGTAWDPVIATNGVRRKETVTIAA